MELHSRQDEHEAFAMRTDPYDDVRLDSHHTRRRRPFQRCVLAV